MTIMIQSTEQDSEWDVMKSIDELYSSRQSGKGRSKF